MSHIHGCLVSEHTIPNILGIHMFFALKTTDDILLITGEFLKCPLYGRLYRLPYLDIPSYIR